MFRPIRPFVSLLAVCFTAARAKRESRLTMTGSRQLEAGLTSWLMLSKFAKVDKLVA